MSSPTTGQSDSYNASLSTAKPITMDQQAQAAGSTVADFFNNVVSELKGKFATGVRKTDEDSDEDMDSSSKDKDSSSSQGTNLTGLELQQELFTRLAEVYDKTGLEPLKEDIPANAVENAAIVGRNNATQIKRAEALEPLVIKYTAELKDALLVIARPNLHTPDEQEAAKALVDIANKSIDTKVIAAGGAKEGYSYNLFLGGLVSIALAEAMMEYMKTQQVGEKIASEMWLETKAVVEDVTDLIAKNIKDKARAEAIEHIVQAACAAGAMVAQIGGGLGSMYAKNMSTGMGYNLAGQGFATLFSGVLQNLALAPLAIVKGGLDADKAVLDMQKEFLNTMMDKMKQMGDEYQKEYNDFNDALKQWLTKTQELITTLTAHK